MWLIIAFACLVAVPSVVERAALERDNDTVQIAVDMESVFELSARTGVAPADVLVRWRDAGVGAVGVERPQDVPLVESSGLLVVPRTVTVLSSVAHPGEQTDPLPPFVAAGDEVDGYPDELRETAAMLMERHRPFGIVEFANQAGAAALARRVDYDVVRVHSIPPDELAHLTVERALARFNRAVFERRLPVLYVHPFLDGTGAELQAKNDDYVARLAALVQQRGFAAGNPAPLPSWSTSPFVPVAALLAAIAGALLVLLRYVTVPPIVFGLGFVAFAGGAVVLFVPDFSVPGRQTVSLAVALVFPVLAVVEAADAFSPTGSKGLVPRVVAAAGRFVTATAAGALLVAAALGDTRFLLQLEQFRGVKIAHVVPLVVVGVVAFVKLRRDNVRTARTTAGWHRHRLVRIAAVIAAAGALFVLVARTGNHVLPVSDLERTLREFLETRLLVRPRTKEFLLGYPALAGALFFAARSQPRLAWPFFIVATVASVSVINTFAHAHIPLIVSLWRAGYGLLFGGAVGLFVVAGGALVGPKPVERQSGAEEGAS